MIENNLLLVVNKQKTNEMKKGKSVSSLVFISININSLDQHYHIMFSNKLDKCIYSVKKLILFYQIKF